MNRKHPFQHPAIYSLIAQYWFAGQQRALIKGVEDRFLAMPDNLIVFVCNAVSVPMLSILSQVLTR